MYVFVTQLGKITINVGKPSNIAFRSKSLVMSHRAFRTNTFVQIIIIIIIIIIIKCNNNNNFPIFYPGCIPTRQRHSQIRNEDHSPSILTCPAHTIDARQVESPAPPNGKCSN